MRQLLLVLALTACATTQSARQPAQEPIGSVRDMYDGRLSPELAVTTFRNIDRLFPSRTIARGERVTPIPGGTPLTAPILCSSGSQVVSLDEYMRLNRVAGLLVLKNGRQVLERYALGNTSRTRWMSMSMAKSITSTLIAIALRDGTIRSLDDSVTTYVPQLRGSAYAGVSVRHVLMMASGVRWNETYTDSSSDRRHLLEAQIAQRPGAALALMGTLARAAAPGSRWNYSTGETLVAGEIVRGATGVPLAQYLSDKLWKPLGMESDATWWLDSPDGHEIAGSGISATLRDYARFAQFVLDDGVIAGRRVVPDGWFREAGSPRPLTTGQSQPYGYMWWPIMPPTDPVNTGAFKAEGIFGQYLYINPAERVVVAQVSAQVKPTGGDVVDPDACFAAITTALRGR